MYHILGQILLWMLINCWKIKWKIEKYTAWWHVARWMDVKEIRTLTNREWDTRRKSIAIWSTRICYWSCHKGRKNNWVFEHTINSIDTNSEWHRDNDAQQKQLQQDV